MKDYIIGKSKDFVSSLSYFLFTYLIVILLKRMNSAIDFDDEAVFVAEKIYDVGSYRSLSTKF